MSGFYFHKYNQIRYVNSFVKKEGFKKFTVYDHYRLNYYDDETLMGLGNDYFSFRGAYKHEYEAITRLNIVLGEVDFESKKYQKTPTEEIVVSFCNCGDAYVIGKEHLCKGMTKVSIEQIPIGDAK